MTLTDMDFADDEEMEDEIVTSTYPLRSLRAIQAPAPCQASTPIPTPGSGRTEPGREPRYRPGSGRVRRTRSRDYVRWLQRSLNRVLGTNLVVDGLWGRQTRAAVRQFQRRENLGVDGVVGRLTEGALRRATGTDAPQREFSAEIEGEGVIAGAALALDFVKFGFEGISRLTRGDISLVAPTSPAGVRVRSQPSHFRLRERTRSVLLTNFIERSPIGIEQVNIKLECKVRYDGLRVQAIFQLRPGGNRSRLGRDAKIEIKPGIVETRRAPEDWVRCGVYEYKALRIPVSFDIDRPWPADNYNETFELVLSTMYGFGGSARGSDRLHIQNRRVAWN